MKLLSKVLLIIFLVLFFISCKRDKQVEPEPYSKRIIFLEDFNAPQGWEILPTASDSGCVKFKDGMLKLIFDQTFENCGCAWVGAGYNNQSVFENELLDKIGFRIKLNKGFFQSIYIPTDTNVNVRKTLLWSILYLYFNGIDICIPSVPSGYFPSDSLINLNFNMLEGREFELIYNKGEKVFNIDGISQSVNGIYFNYGNFNKYLQITFMLGHAPEISPRIDTLYIDEIEIYTWSGEL